MMPMSYDIPGMSPVVQEPIQQTQNLNNPINNGNVPSSNIPPPPPATGLEKETNGSLTDLNNISQQYYSGNSDGLFSLNNNINHSYIFTANNVMEGYESNNKNIDNGMMSSINNQSIPPNVNSYQNRTTFSQKGLIPPMMEIQKETNNNVENIKSGEILPFGYINLPKPIESNDFIKISTNTVVSKDIYDSSIPLCAILQPMATQSLGRSTEEAPTAGIVHRVPRINKEPIRCTKCQAYINCYSLISKEPRNSTGANWTCSICGNLNQIPKIYHDAAAKITEKYVTNDVNDDLKTKLIYSEFPELIHNTYECRLFKGYITRAPMPPLFIFVIDVNNLVGHEEIVAELVSIKKTINQLVRISKELSSNNNGAHTKFVRASVVAYDTNVHLFSFIGEDNNDTGSETKFKEYILPSRTDTFPAVLISKFVANLTTQGSGVSHLIDVLLNRYLNDSKKCNTILGTNIKQFEAIEAAVMIIKATPDCIKINGETPNVSGRIIHYNHSLQSQGKGLMSLKTRDKITDDTTIEDLQCSNNNWKQLAIDAANACIVVDSYVISTNPNPYRGVAIQSVFSEFTGGSIEYYPSFNRLRDQEGITNDLYESIFCKDYIYDCDNNDDSGKTKELNQIEREDCIKITDGMTKCLVPSYAYDCAIRVRVSDMVGNKISINDYYGCCQYSDTKLIVCSGIDRHSSFMIDLSAEITSTAYIQICLLYTDLLGNRLMRICTTPVHAGDRNSHYESFDPITVSSFFAKKATKRLIDNRINKGTTKGKNSNFFGPQKLSEEIVEKTARIISDAMKWNKTIPSNISMFGIYMMGLVRSKMLKTPNIDEMAYVISLVRRNTVDLSTSLLYTKMFRLDDASQQRLLLRKLDPHCMYILGDLYCIYIYSGEQVDDAMEKEYYSNDSEFPQLRWDAKNVNELVQRLRRTRGKQLPVFCVPKKSRLQPYIKSLMIEDTGDLTNEEWNRRLNSVVMTL